MIFRSRLVSFRAETSYLLGFELRWAERLYKCERATPLIAFKLCGQCGCVFDGLWLCFMLADYVIQFLIAVLVAWFILVLVGDTICFFMCIVFPHEHCHLFV